MCFRFSERFCFGSTDYAVNFFTKSHCHSFLFCRERVILVSYFGLPLSYNQNTEQDTLPCSKVSSKNKQKISLHSFSLFFSVVTSNQAQQISNSRRANLDAKRRSYNVFHWALWAKGKSRWYISDQDTINYSLKSRRTQLKWFFSTYQTQHFVLTRAACSYLCFLRLSVSSLKQYNPCLLLKR